MPETESEKLSNEETGSGVKLAARGALGGVLMGFANLVPGISGGAMLLLVGVYTRFITAVAELTTLKFRPASLVVFFTVACGAGLTILLLAGVVKDVVLAYTWQVYALLIGMRLGVVPLIWGKARPAGRRFFIAAACGLGVTVLVAAGRYTTDDFGAAGPDSPGMMFLAGLLGSMATLLPGLDGSYVLMLLGQYVPILGAVERLKDALAAGDWDGIVAQMLVLAPVALGVACGIGGVSLLLRWLLAKHPQATYGALVGILVGAVIGLWPFQRYTAPKVGQMLRSAVMTAESVAAMPRDEWPVRFFTPNAVQALAAACLAVLGFGLALLLERLSPPDAGGSAKTGAVV